MAKRAASKGNGKPAGKAKRGGRKSKAESMTGAKADEVEMKPVLDLQPIEIDERDFNLHLRAIKSATEKEQTAKSLRMTCEKRAKEADPKILTAVKKTMKLERQDQSTIEEDLQVLGFALKHANSPIQMTLHNTLLGDVNEQAYKRGFKDGEAGKSASDDYPSGSELSKHYMRGWQHGMGKNVGKTPAEVDAALADGDDAGDPNKLWNEAAPHLTETTEAAGTA